MRSRKLEGVDQMLDDRRTGVLHPHPALNIGLDRTHRMRSHAHGDRHAFYPAVELERGLDVEKATVPDNAPPHGDSDGRQQARPAKNPVHP